jgi:cellulose synthase/poly-beta-1,6-N-acetylglucosamine synthase-like glycosyltransferase
MTVLSGPFLDLLFVLSAVTIWFMIAYQFVLFVAGLLYNRAAGRKSATEAIAWPGVSILVPARNEARVIVRTLEALLALDYPHDRLEITIVDDGSIDGTPTLVDAMAARDPRMRCLSVPPWEAGRGKAAALNFGLKEVHHELVAIYDADNRPEPGSLRTLVLALEREPNLAAAVGKFRTLNRDRNLLTRFINIESLAFQWIVQAGRCALLGVTTLPGTNFVIRRRALERVGGWDEQALTEDAELTIRVYETGGRIRFVPDAVSWEQEPERLRTWFRQRTRWARGQNYVLAKHLRRLLQLRPRVLAVELLYTLAIYYVVFAAIGISDIMFVLAGFGFISVRAPGPYSEVWLLAFALFVLEIAIALSREPGEDSLVTLCLVLVGYFTYCQLWIPVVLRAFADDVVFRRKRVWAKTERFAEAGTLPR